MSRNGYKEFFRKAQKIQEQKPSRLPRINLNWVKKIPLYGAGLVLVFGLGYTLYDEGEWINKALDKVDIGFFGKAGAAEKDKKKDKSKDKKGAAKGAGAKDKKSTDEAAAAEEAKGPKKSWTDEEVALFTKLEERKTQLDTKEQELQKLEAELQKEREELEKRLGQLEDVRRKIASKLDEKVKVDQAKVDSLVAVYQNMKPAQAAKIFEDMNEDLAVEVLGKMKNKSAAEVLNMIKPEKAKRLTERFAGYKEN